MFLSSYCRAVPHRGFQTITQVVVHAEVRLPGIYDREAIRGSLIFFSASRKELLDTPYEFGVTVTCCHRETWLRP